MAAMKSLNVSYRNNLSRACHTVAISLNDPVPHEKNITNY